MHISRSMLAPLRPADVARRAPTASGHSSGARRSLRSVALSELAGGDVYLKLENEQITGSFKLRGALNVLATLARRRAPARRRRVLGRQPRARRGLRGEALRRAGHDLRAEHRGAGEARRHHRARRDDRHDQPHYDAAMEAAIAFADEHGSTFINPCAGDMLLAGQGTVALEILGDLPDLASLVVSVGGGGLLGGCASLMRAVAPRRGSSARRARTRRRCRGRSRRAASCEIDNLPTLAEGLAGQIDDYALDIGRRTLDEIVTVSEDEIARAIALALAAHAAARRRCGRLCGVRAVLDSGRFVRSQRPAAIVVSGGNIDVGAIRARSRARERWLERRRTPGRLPRSDPRGSRLQSARAPPSVRLVISEVLAAR